MPNPWLFSQWACSPWQAEPGRDAAIDSARMAEGGSTRLADFMPEHVPVKDPAEYMAADWFAAVTEDWPEVPNVLASDLQVLKDHDNQVLEWVNLGRAEDNKKTYLVCWDRAAFQLCVAGFSPSGPPARDPESTLVLREHRQGNGTIADLQVHAMVRAMSYLKTALLGEIPVMIGFKINGYESEPNNIWGTPYIIPTDHFVVAVGMGRQDGRPYVNYFNYSHRYEATDKLYLGEDMFMRSGAGSYTLTEMRVSTPRAAACVLR